METISLNFTPWSRKKSETSEKFSKSDLVKRLSIVLDECKISKKDLALHGNVSAKTITNIFSNSSTPNAKSLAGWAKNLDININWLLTGDGDMFRGSPPQEPTANVQRALGPVAEHVDGIERGLKHSPLPMVIEVTLEELKAWRNKEAQKRHGVAREANPVFAHEDTMNFQPGDACGIDGAPLLSPCNRPT